MNLTSMRSVIAGALGLCFAARCFADLPNPEGINDLFAQWNRDDSPGAAIVIVQNGAVVYQRGYGYANLQHRVPITPQTLFDCASVAKQFTGLSVAMLVQQGKLSLADDIRKHLVNVPDFGNPITIANLVYHTSGLRDWPETLGISGVDMEGTISLEMILEMVRRQRELDFMPGEEHAYSNTGYNLLAAAIAKVTGESFRSWTDQNLFQPLGMKQTQVCDNAAEIVGGCADSYAPVGSNKFQRVTSQLSAQGSSSLLVSAEDMGRWLLNFETQEIGGKAALDLMHQPGRLTNGDKVNYGFGVSLGTFAAMPTVSHSGSWAGYRSIVLRIPEKRFAVAVLSNAGNMNTWDIAAKITGMCLNLPRPPSAKTDAAKTVQPTDAVKSDPATWEPFPGTYRLGPGWLLTISREGDQLMTQATSEAKFNMLPISTNTFFVEAYNQPIEFVRQPSGVVTNLLYRGLKAPKINLPNLTAGDLVVYAGDYWSEELRDLTRIETHDGKLAVRMRSGNWLDLLPSGGDRFDIVGGLVIVFTRGADSKISEARISGNRVRNLRYTRVTLPEKAAGR